jgi:hypothetical protein
MECIPLHKNVLRAKESSRATQPFSKLPPPHRIMRLTASVLFPALYHLRFGRTASTSDVAAAPGWQFVKNGSAGIVALEAIVVSPTLIVTFDRAQHNPLMINNHSAWAALWNMETNTATPLNAVTDTFCASGSILSNGTMVCAYLSSPMRYLTTVIGQCWRDACRKRCRST